MRILIVSPYIPCECIGGSGIKLEYTLRRLSEHHKITLLTFFPSKKRFSVPEGVEIIHHPHQYEWDKLSMLRKTDPFTYYTRFFCKRVEKIIKEKIHCFDLLYLDSLFCYQYRQRNIPTIVDMHNFHSELIARYIRRENNPIKKSYLKFLLFTFLIIEKRILKSDSGKILTGPVPEWHNESENTANVIPYPYWYEDDIRDDLNRMKHVLFTANFNWSFNRKAVKRILRVAKAFPTLEFHIAGKSLKLKRYPDNVTAYHSPSDMSDLFKKCGIFLDMSQTGSGINIKLLQALKYNMLILSSANRIRRIPDMDKVCIDIGKDHVHKVLKERDILLKERNTQINMLNKRFSNDTTLISFISAQKI